MKWNRGDTFADIHFLYLSCVIFKGNCIFNKVSDKIVIVEEELHGVDIDDIGNRIH